MRPGMKASRLNKLMYFIYKRDTQEKINKKKGGSAKTTNELRESKCISMHTWKEIKVTYLRINKGIQRRHAKGMKYISICIHQL